MIALWYIKYIPIKLLKKKKKQTPCLWKGPLLLPNAEALASISMTKGIEQS